MGKEANIISPVEAFKSNRIDCIKPDSDSPFYDLFRSVADEMPYFIPTELRQETLLAARSGDKDARASAIKSFLAQNARTIVHVVDNYFMLGQDKSELDELTMTAVTSVLEKIGGFDTIIPMHKQIYDTSERAIADYVFVRDGMPKRLVLNPHYRVIVSTIEAVIGDNRRRLALDEINALAQELAKETQASKHQLREYILHRNSIDVDHVSEGIAKGGDTTWRTVWAELKEEAIEEAVDGLSERERDVLRRYFGLGDIEEKTLEEIGNYMGITASRISQIKGIVIRRLRHPSKAKRIKPFYLSDQEAD